jgi:AcrR family transcriptional regulator
VVAAAEARFRADGYSATRTTAIAADAGVAEGTIFHYFGSKAGLLEAVIEGYGLRMVEAMFHDTPADAPPDVRAILSRVFEFVGREGPLVAQFEQVAETRALGEIHRDVVVEALHRAILRWRRYGHVEVTDAARTAALAFAMVRGALRACFVEDDGSDQRRWLGATAQALARTLGVNAQAASKPRARHRRSGRDS